MDTYKFWKGMRVRVVHPDQEILSDAGPMQMIEYPINGQLETGYAYIKDLSDMPVEARPPFSNDANDKAVAVASLYLYSLTDEMRSLTDEYTRYNRKRTEMEREYPTPSGGEEFDYLTLRDNMDYRYILQRLSEIEERVGVLVIQQVTRIYR